MKTILVMVVLVLSTYALWLSGADSAGSDVGPLRAEKYAEIAAAQVPEDVEHEPDLLTIGSSDSQSRVDGAKGVAEDSGSGPRTNLDVVNDWYGENADLVLGLAREAGLKDEVLMREAVLIPEAEARQMLITEIMFGDSSYDPDAPYESLDRQMKRLYSPDPLKDVGEQVLQDWNPYSKGLGEDELHSVQLIIDGFRESFEQAYEPYRQSYLDWRSRLAVTDGAYHLSPIFHDPRLDEQALSASSNASTTGGLGGGWYFQIYYDEASDPAHGPMYIQMRALYDQRRAAIMDFISGL
jgi:hypothetical protein